ncbi:cation diffusion facilitator family transporter [Flexistipes sinusarabici DSM 4947]|uniref:Cation diffusion facilitator family transporter n=1 Tax=Flexistipes sinusarabici (strain ATCC 49648 / DSM 4947 / MAS 10) TaxID=717231 RepID=F8E7P0_FLESM|nr:cation diffusion facilitator family transporter [Flexistipes sinusarabici]AEI13885.1 cation diffusion facilitator family transporter [Flexistipes sinusarabici DSM 4947]
MTRKTAAALTSVFVAGTLAVIKLVTGLMINSLVIVTSAVDSIMDIVTSSINYYAIKASEQPPDKEHPFGHHKYESLATFIQSIIIMLSGFYILYEAYSKYINKESVTNVNNGLYVMFFSILITLFLTIFLRRTAKREESAVLKADALHYEIDILTNLGVIGTLFVVKFTGIEIIDPVVSVLIAVYIVYSALKLNFNVTKDLVDTELPVDIKEKIIDIIKQYDDYHLDFHRLRTRQAGSKKFVDLHLTLCREVSLNDAHKIADTIEKRIKDEIKNSDVIIHIEPCTDENCPGIEHCEKKVRIDIE